MYVYIYREEKEEETTKGQTDNKKAAPVYRRCPLKNNKKLKKIKIIKIIKRPHLSIEDVHWMIPCALFVCVSE
jgi:hypothetical protein